MADDPISTKPTIFETNCLMDTQFEPPRITLDVTTKTTSTVRYCKHIVVNVVATGVVVVDGMIKLAVEVTISQKCESEFKT